MRRGEIIRIIEGKMDIMVIEKCACQQVQSHVQKQGSYKLVLETLPKFTLKKCMTKWLRKRRTNQWSQGASMGNLYTCVWHVELNKTFKKLI